jgi:hypothetical protein
VIVSVLGLIVVVMSRSTTIAMGRSPNALRGAGVLTVIVAAAVPLGMLAMFGAARGWSIAHGLLAVATIVVAFAVAHQWPTTAFRGYLLLLAVLTLLIALRVGQAETLQDRVLESRSAAARLDGRLSEAQVQAPSGLGADIAAASSVVSSASWVRNHDSTAAPSVALVRGLRRSSTAASSRVMIFCASVSSRVDSVR